MTDIDTTGIRERNYKLERDAAHIEVAARTAERDGWKRIADDTCDALGVAEAAIARVRALCERGYGPAIVEIVEALDGAS